VFGDEYRKLLSRARIVFNRSIRGECNKRVFEAAATGALLFQCRGKPKRVMPTRLLWLRQQSPGQLLGQRRIALWPTERPPDLSVRRRSPDLADLLIAARSTTPLHHPFPFRLD